MSDVESVTLTLLLIFAGISFLPLLAKRLRLPVIVAEILFGIAIGRSWLDLVPDTPLIAFLASFGLVYLMFLAGLHVDLGVVTRRLNQTVAIALASITLPFVAGALIAPTLGAHPLIVGTIFSTTSLGLVLPLQKEVKGDREMTNLLLGSVVVVDILSIFLLGFVIVAMDGNLDMGFVYGLLAILTLFVLPWLVNRPRVQGALRRWLFRDTEFEHHVRFSFALIFLLGAISGTLGFHSIVGAFIAGLVVSELTPNTSRLEAKLESFGYGFFIPLFFIFIGAKVNLPALFSDLGNLGLLLAVIALSIGTKVAAVTGVARITGLAWKESTAFGFFHAARLSLIIAAAEIASEMQLISTNLFSMFILLALASAVLGPSIGKLLLRARPHDAAAPEPIAAIGQAPP